MTWPATNVPATAPTTHGPVRTQAYQAGGGDYFMSGWYSHGISSGALTTASLGLNTMHVRPFRVPVRRAFDRLGINVTVAATVGGVLRMGIYADGGGRPVTRILDAGTVSSESTGAKEVVIAQTLDPGLYWLACVAQVATCTVTAYATATMTPYTPFFDPPVSAQGVRYTQSGVSGALPNPSTAGLNASAAAAVCLRAA